jgi:cytochrome c oxidase subunit 2
MPSPVRRKLTVLVCFALLGLVFAHVALADDPAGLSPRGPDSPQASRIEDIYWLLVAVTGVIFILVEGALILFIFRFRRRKRPRNLEGPQIHGATRLELIWTAIPIVILIGIVTFILVKLPGINHVESAQASGREVEATVDGHQFYWNFVYPNGVIQVQTLTLPAARPITLRIRSADVDHSWWIPPLQGKFDAIPGKTNYQHFVADKTGTYIGQCGEFCGYEHPHMVGKVKVVDASEFVSWLQRQAQAQKSGTSDLGKQTWDGVCATCHGLDAKGAYGPNLVGNPLLTQPVALQTLLRNGRNKMPAVGKGWTDTQMGALIRYVRRFANGG